MNINKIVFMLTLLSVMCPLQSVQAQAKPAAAMENNLRSVTLDMQNMTCGLCKITIKKALQGVDGVKQVQVDFGSKTAAVTFDPQKTTIDALIEATTNVGYPATVHPPR